MEAQVDAVVELYNGIPINIEIFGNTQLAKKYIINYLKYDIDIDISEEASIEEVLNEVKILNENIEGNDIRWYSRVNIIGGLK